MIIYITAFAMLILTSMQSLAHEMTPTYPELRPSYVDGLYSTKMKLFNRRDDVLYYDIGVFDKDWNPIYFVADYKVIRLKYLSSASIDVYIARENKDRVEYICSRSKIRKDNNTRPAVTSRICSRFK